MSFGKNTALFGTFLILMATLSSCSEVSTYVLEKDRPTVTLATAEISESKTFKFTPNNCEISPSLLVTENASSPSGSEAEWTTCSRTQGSLSYTLAVDKPTTKVLYIWGKNKADKVLRTPKKITVKYAPRFLYGQVNEKVSPQFNYGYFAPTDIKLIGGKFYATSSDSSRVYVYNSIPSTSFPVPDLILGQKQGQLLFSASTKANRFASPFAVASDGTRFAMVDSESHRVLLWNSIPTSSETPADFVLGQTDFTSRQINGGHGSNPTILNCSMFNQPYDVAFYNGRLFVSDLGNNRVLIWNTWPSANNQSADVVIGQPDCSSALSLTTASSLRGPRSVVFGPSGQMAVGDYSNNRILIWNTVPSTSGASADLVLGQSSFTSGGTNSGGISASSLRNPRRLATNGTAFAAVDSGNNRVLIWNAWPTSNNQASNVVLGQADFASGSANRGARVTPDSMNAPIGISFIAGDLWVADNSNNRLLKFNGLPSTNGVAANLIVGQSPLTQRDHTFGIDAHTMNRVYDVDQQPNGSYLVTDYSFGRILIFNSKPTSPTQDADSIFGQSNFTSGLPNAGGDPTGATVYNPRSTARSATHFFIADEANYRVLVFNSPNLSASSVAIAALGQPDLNTRVRNNGGVTASSMSTPYQIATDGTKLAVVDAANHRVLIWNTIPTNSAQPADVVVGQPDMTTATENTGGLSASTLASPRGVIFIEGRMYIGDQGNRRILIYNSIPTTNGAAADVVIGQRNFNVREMAPAGLSKILSFAPLYFKYNHGHFTVGNYDHSSILVWKGAPTEKNQEPDYEVGGNFSSGPMSEFAEPIDYDNSPVAYHAESDGTTLTIPNYYLARVVSSPIPSITAESIWSNTRALRMSVDSCENRSAVLFNELDTPPSATDSQWQTCSTRRWSLSANLSAGDGIKKLKAWFKDEDGYVLPYPQQIRVALVSRYNQDNPVDLASSSITNSPTLSFTTAESNTQRGLYMRYLFTESSTVPTESNSGWVDRRATDTEAISYTLTNSNEGIRTVYLWTMDLFGNVSPLPNTYRIVLDQTPPAAPVFNLSGFYAGTRDTLARLTVSSCADIAKVSFSDSPSAPTPSSTWTNCSTALHGHSFTIPGITEGHHTIYGWSMDLAGNISTLSHSVPANFTTHLTWGQSDPNSVATAANGLASPGGIHSDGTRFLVADSANGRVLLFNGDPTANTPAVVLGKPSLTYVGRESTVLVTASTLSYPMGAIFMGSKIAVADIDNNRVLIWNSIPTSHGTPADVVLGQPDMNSYSTNNGGISCATLSSPRGLSWDGTRLAVADYTNNRVLIWNSVPTSNFTPADVVIGAGDCTTNTSGTSNRNLKGPYDTSFANGQLLITDSGNHRVLIYNSVPTAHNATADLVVGQPDFNTANSATSATALKSPRSAYVADNKLFVADSSNNRLVVYSPVPTSIPATASAVLGQGNTTNSGASTGATRMSSPTGVYATASAVWVTDSSNHRIKKFAPTYTTGNSAVGFYGGSDIANSPSIVNMRSASSTSDLQVLKPTGILQIGSKFLVADSINNRVLIWNSMPTSTATPADNVIGHMTMTATIYNDTAVAAGARLRNPMALATDGTKLFIADQGNNRILVYNSVPTSNGVVANYAIGQTAPTGSSSGAGANQLNSPYDVTISGGRLFVADSGNHRVLIFNTVPTTNDASADVILGQTAAGTNAANMGGSVSAQSLNSPRGVVVVGTKIIVADTVNDRALVWNSIPSSHGASADIAIGQASLTATGTSSSSTFDSPYTVRYWDTKLFILDRNRHRIWGFNGVPTSSGQLPDYILGQNSASSASQNRHGVSGLGFMTPGDLYFDGSHYWFADDNHRLLKTSWPF